MYQAKQTQKLFEENLKVSKQREKDYSNLVENGVLAKNDLLKVKLQSSNIQLGLDSAIKNANVINNQLVSVMQLPENTTIEIDIATTKSDTVRPNNLLKYCRKKLKKKFLKQMKIINYL